ncbi:HEAT repeat domain-containing protein [Candidatus Methylobacter favarea]|nr:HEAT repeat domain-containing protein [Candidatus Methylobacter favarea]
MPIFSYARFQIVCSLLLMPHLAPAAGNISKSDQQKISVVLTKDKGVELQLEIRQAPMAQVLGAIADKTGVPINYTVLPDGLVNATCVGTTVKQVMECLFNNKADLIFRYAEQSANKEQQTQLAEVWVLGARIGGDQASSSGCSMPGVQTQSAPAAANAQSEPAPDETDDLVKMTASKVPAKRAEAVGRLLAEGRKNDPSVREALEAALSDKDAKVRAQALSTLAHREGAGAAAALREAIHDNDVSVRLTAVDNAGGDPGLLQQALTDENASVRELAALRLRPIAKLGSAQ